MEFLSDAPSYLRLGLPEPGTPRTAFNEGWKQPHPLTALPQRPLCLKAV